MPGNQVFDNLTDHRVLYLAKIIFLRKMLRLVKERLNANVMAVQCL